MAKNIPNYLYQITIKQTNLLDFFLACARENHVTKIRKFRQWGVIKFTGSKKHESWTLLVIKLP